MKDKIFSIIIAFVLLMILVMSARDLQIIQGAELRNDSVTRFKTTFVDAQRGIIFDKNGEVLAQNKTTYSFYIKPSEIKNIDGLKTILQNAGFTDIDFIIQKYNTKKDFESVLIEKNYVNAMFTTKYFADPQKYKEIEITESYLRYYPYKDIISHAIGYTGEVTEEEGKLGYRDNTEIGKAGLELSYDKLLRGADGKISIDSKTGTSEVEAEPVNGKNLYLSIDINIQKKLNELLNSAIDEYKADGAVGILQDLSTGEILSYVSLPSFDDNLFVGGIGEKDYDKLNKDPKTPQIDRISNATYPPGSVFKMNTATALLESNSITKDTTQYTGGIFKYGGTTFRDFSNINQGTLNVVGGLCRSSNIFFMKSSLLMDDHTQGKAIDEINKYAAMYGLGKRTGIDLPEGIPGYISSPETKRNLYDEGWVGGDLLNAAIGQGYTLVSPIQIMSLTSTIANNGKILQPHLVASVSDSVNSAKMPAPIVIKNTLNNIKQSTFDTIKEGLYCGVHDGIIQDLNSQYVSVSAKSGTAEYGAPDPATGLYPNRHAWATGFFPTDKPKYGFTLMLEKGGTSGNTVKVARSFIDWLYRDYQLDKK